MRTSKLTIFVCLVLSVAFHLLAIPPLFEHWGIGTFAPPAKTVVVATNTPIVRSELSKPPQEDLDDPFEPESRLGMADVSGTSINQSDGEQPTLARLGPQDQAALAMTPGLPGSATPRQPGNRKPVDQKQPQNQDERSKPTDATNDPNSASAEATLSAAPDKPAVALVAPSPVPGPSDKTPGPTIAIASGPRKPSPSDMPSEDNAQSTPAQRPAPQTPGDPPSDRIPSPSAAPAVAPGNNGEAGQSSPSESDAFAKNASVIFRAGKVDARLGRAFRSVKPKINLAGFVDRATLPGARVTLRFKIDTSGQVTDVSVVRSSGSSAIDQPCKLAMYEWWFEPKHDANGLAVPDEQTLTIGFE